MSHAGLIIKAKSRMLSLPLEGGGWNVTDLDRRSRSSMQARTGGLSAMTFLVGVRRRA
jgi:hypothetical protein